MTFDDFTPAFVETPLATIRIRRAGHGPAVLLLHGFPETSLAWRKVAPALARAHTVIAADLPGYGESTVSERAFEEGRLSKRTMGRALAEMMAALGFSTFALAGHDRGARVAYRLALDQPERIAALALLDVLPIVDMAERLTYDAARAMAHWIWLSQASTLPETLIGHDVDRYVRFILDQWGGGDARVIEPAVADEYARWLRTPGNLRAMGAEYRADLIDLAHDRADRAAGRRIACPVLVAWAQGGLVEMFGDPLAIWREWTSSAPRAAAIRAGHFLMEESPGELTRLLRELLDAAASSTPRAAAAGTP